MYSSSNGRTPICIGTAGIRRLTGLLVLIALGAILFGGMKSAAAAVASTRTDTGNVYFRGDEIDIPEFVVGDLFAAGRRVVVGNSVGADGAVAGGSVNINADVAGDLRLAGGNVNINAGVGGDLLAAGGTVRISGASTVSGPALIAGGEVIVDGRLDQGAKIYADKIFLSGQINGDAKLYGREIVFAPEARINGNLVYASANPLPQERLAQVSGKVVREKTPERWGKGQKPFGAIGLFHPIFFLSMLVCGVLLYLFFPNAVDGTRQTIKRYPLRSLLIGLALLFTIPPVAMIFIVTVVGIPIGFALLMLYPLFLLLGYLATAFFISRETANVMHQPKDFTRGKQIAFLAAALLIMAVVAMIPVLGGLIMFTALLAGIGGWAVWLYQRYPKHASSAVTEI